MTSVIYVGCRAGDKVETEKILGGARLQVALSNGGTLKQARAKFGRDYIAAVLEQHHGRISEAARVFGIQRTNLYCKMRSFRIKSHSHGRS